MRSPLRPRHATSVTARPRVYLGWTGGRGLKRTRMPYAWYQNVESGDRLSAQRKIATLISRQQGLGAGREYLRRIEPRSGEDRIQVIQVEAQLLRDAKAWKDTYDMLSGAVREYPDSFELRYDRAMAAERVDRLDVLEDDLRQVIRMKPDYAHAYNALGYTLAEKTDRLAEAKELIEEAYKLLPEDPFILDSLGWVHYRLGNVGRRSSTADAYNAAPIRRSRNTWARGAGRQASATRAQGWRTALSANPDHETLITVMQKFRP